MAGKFWFRKTVAVPIIYYYLSHRKTGAVPIIAFNYPENYTIRQMKEYLRDRGIPMNL
jgi:hypothetical protein